MGGSCIDGIWAGGSRTVMCMTARTGPPCCMQNSLWSGFGGGHSEGATVVAGSASIAKVKAHGRWSRAGSCSNGTCTGSDTGKVMGVTVGTSSGA